MLSQSETFALLLLVAAAESITLAILVGRRQSRGRGTMPFILMMLGVAVWSVGYAVELTTLDLEGKLYWTGVQYVGIVTVPVMLLLFVLAYTQRQRWLAPTRVVFLLVVPVATLLVMWTNSIHGLFYQGVGLETIGGISQFIPSYGPWFWVHSGYSYLLMLTSVVLLIRTLVKSPQFYRGQAATLLLGLLAPWIANALYIFKLIPLQGLDLTPFAFTITGLALGWSLISFRLMDIIPMARDAVMENMADAVIVLDVQNRIVDLNPAAHGVLGEAGHNAIGKPIRDVMPERRDLLRRFEHTLEANTEIAVGEGSESRTFDLMISPLRGRQKELTGRLIVLRDITERKRAEQALERAHHHALEALRVKSRILAIVSHDFRTPLSAIIGYADMLQQPGYGPLTDQQRNQIGRILANAAQLTTLVNDLLDQAQIDESRITLNITPFEPKRLTQALESAMGPRAREKGLALIGELTADLPDKVYGDLPRIIQVVSNLVENALKFTEQGAITTRVYVHDATHWGVQVRDTGLGMSPEVQARIFDPFWQADSSVTRAQRGIGLGLSIAKQLTVMMGGSITVESRVGEGTTFCVLFPLTTTAKEQEHVKAASLSR